MDTNTHKVKSITVTERERVDYKVITIKVVATILRWCTDSCDHVEQEVEHVHTFFTNDLDLELEFVEAGQE